MSTPKETKSNTKEGKDRKPNTTPKNYITTGIGKHLLTPCRRIGLSRKTPNSKALDIFKPKNDITSKSSISTEKDIISTPIMGVKLPSTPSDARKTRTSNEKDIICATSNVPNNLDDTPKPEPKSKGKARSLARTKKIIACDAVRIDNNDDLINVTPASKKAVAKIEQIQVETLDFSNTNVDSGNSLTKVSKPEKNMKKPIKKINKTTKNYNNNDELLNTDCQENAFIISNEPEADDRKQQTNPIFKPEQKLDNCSDSSDEDSKLTTRKKRKPINSSDSDSDCVPLKSLIVTVAQMHHPPVKRCINFNEQKSDEPISSDSSEGLRRTSNAKKSKLRKNTTKRQDSKRIILKKTFTTDSEDDMFISTPDDDKKQSENLLRLVTALEKEINKKEDCLEKLKQAEVYRKRHCPETLQQSIDLWLQGCKESLKDLLVKAQEKGPKDMNMLLKDLNISDEIVAKLKQGVNHP